MRSLEEIEMKRIIPLLAIALIAVIVNAGDLAVVENLGFSPDGKYFMLGQHVFETEFSQAYAEIAVVDVAGNSFTSGGWKKYTWKLPVTANQNSRGGLYELLSQNLDLKKRYNINHLEQGRMLYTQSAEDQTNMESSDGSESPGLSFRDFEWGREYFLILKQDSGTKAGKEAASFYIDLKVVESSGITSEYKIGRPGFMREGVSSYEIARIWLGPDGKSLVIAVAKEKSDLSVRFMVETLRIR